MKSVTIDTVMGWHSCPDYSRYEITKLFAGREQLSWRDFLALDIQTRHILWVLLHEEFLPARRIHIFACELAEEVLLPLYEAEYPDDKRLRFAIEIKRRWLDGLATNAELTAARSVAEREAPFLRRLNPTVSWR